MVTSTLLRFIFPPPSSLFITAMSVFSFTSTAYLGFSELRGKHLPYSKFWNGSSTKSGRRKQTEVCSRKGMLFGYTPAFLACLTSFVLLAPQDTRFLLLRSALTLHFFKRIFEVHSFLFLFWLSSWEFKDETDPKTSFPLMIHMYISLVCHALIGAVCSQIQWGDGS